MYGWMLFGRFRTLSWDEQRAFRLAFVLDTCDRGLTFTNLKLVVYTSIFTFSRNFGICSGGNALFRHGRALDDVPWSASSTGRLALRLYFTRLAPTFWSRRFRSCYGLSAVHTIVGDHGVLTFCGLLLFPVLDSCLISVTTGLPSLVVRFVSGWVQTLPLDPVMCFGLGEDRSDLVFLVLVDFAVRVRRR